MISTSTPGTGRQPDFPSTEREVLRWWDKEGTFQQSLDRRTGAPGYVFYDGPPFANGLPHYGHLLTGFVKDIIPRYWTMRGRRVPRRFGWDCHGLPVEIEVEQHLGVFGRSKIIEFGIDRFNEACRKSVLTYRDVWEAYVYRQARWVDFKNDYKTMDLSYMESVIWAFKQLYDKGLVYEGFRVLPYCWECETPLSNFETRLDDAYRERLDPAVTVAFLLKPDGAEPPTALLVWTTTPWTLPSNLALAVNPDIEYVVFERGEAGFGGLGEEISRVVVAAAAVDRYEPELHGAREVGRLPGSELVGRTYTPLFGYFASTPGAFRILAGEFVETESGTGVVHLAPGFGEDDQRVCQEAGIAVVVPVDERGRFTDPVTDYRGVQVFEANRLIISALRERGLVARSEQYAHSYPHCWRSDTPLIYRAMSSWFVAVTKFRDRMVELNQQINWVPGHVRDGAFGNWLANARDWSISRNRFWGTPIPIWVSDDPRYPRIDVYGSLDELERDFGVRPTDLHRPAIDRLTRPNPDDPTGRSTMRRVSDILDVWFDSGSMPFAQQHYPFENREWFERHSPADFIVEYIGQVRGWFYTLHVLSTALFDRPAFTNAMVHGVLLGEDGRKLSKRLRNFPEPQDIFDRYGADAMRWFLVSSPAVNGHDLSVSEEGFAIAARAVLRPLWNSVNFFQVYAATDGYAATVRTDSAKLLDRYILSLTRSLVERLQTGLEAYDLISACQVVEGFLDNLNNWYIRRSRERFWGSGLSQDKRDAYDTLFTVLDTTVRALAPLLPLTTEDLYARLGNSGSVHLKDWPGVSAFPADSGLLDDMDFAREVCATVLNIRQGAGRRVREPLRRIVVTGEGADRLAPLREMIAAEVNVKEIVLESGAEPAASRRLVLNLRVLGPRFGRQMQEIIKAAKAGEWRDRGDGTVEVLGHVLGEGEMEVVQDTGEDAAAGVIRGGRATVHVDLTPTPELRREGLVRDLLRLIQQERKNAGLELSDRIVLRLALDDEMRSAVEEDLPNVREQTLAVAVEWTSPDGAGATGKLSDGRPVGIAIERA